VRVIKINNPTNNNRQAGLAKTGINRKLSNHPNFTRESKRCSQVTGCSKYKPRGRDRSKSIGVYGLIELNRSILRYLAPFPNLFYPRMGDWWKHFSHWVTGVRVRGD